MPATSARAPSGHERPWYVTAFTSRRSGNALGAFACAAMLGFGFYLQYAKGLEPCPLCMLQRVALGAVGIAFLLAAIHHPKRVGAWIYGVLVTLSASAGLAVAGRHVWLQHLPEDRRPMCGPTLEFMLDSVGAVEAVRRTLRGTGDCAVVDWTFLTLSIPEWTLMAFAGFFVYALYLASRP